MKGERQVYGKRKVRLRELIKKKGERACFSSLAGRRRNPGLMLDACLMLSFLNRLAPIAFTPARHGKIFIMFMLPRYERDYVPHAPNSLSSHSGYLQ
jgi:hypothetical protein